MFSSRNGSSLHRLTVNLIKNINTFRYKVIEQMYTPVPIKAYSLQMQYVVVKQNRTPH